MTKQKRLSVLIIDDNEMIRTVLRVIIQSDTYDVIGDASGSEAGLFQFSKLWPDVVCLDVQMPDGDGLKVLEQIKQIAPQTVILMVTASSDRETVQTALQRGAAGFIIKPFNSGTVLDALKKSTAPLRAKKTPPT